ncbi:MAG: CtsR family transcriptional regulator [Clostridia bacterium]|nr:CtsR family transcriptional regulator [Clostridia bacterium]
MKMSDVIENFIRELFENESSIELKRNELAGYFNCVPSQINYVISTRFTTERGYIVESRRGGGGHIKITRVAMNRNDGIRHILSSIGDSLDVMTAEALVNTLYINKTINENQAKLIITACSNNSLSPIADGMVKNRVRASIFKNLLLMFI